MALTPSRFVKAMTELVGEADAVVAYQHLAEHAPSLFWPDRTIPPLTLIEAGQGYLLMAQDHSVTRTLTRTEAEDLIALVKDERKWRGWR